MTDLQRTVNPWPAALDPPQGGRPPESGSEVQDMDGQDLVAVGGKDSSGLTDLGLVLGMEPLATRS